MSIETLLNSPNATYEYPLTLLNTLTTGNQILAVNDGSLMGDLKVICVTDAVTSSYLTVPAGTYNIQMICGMKPPTNASLSYAQLKIVDDSDAIITTSSSKSFASGATSNRYVQWVFNESQRVVFGKSTNITMNILYSNLVGVGGVEILNDIIEGTIININPKIILTPTF
jgi:hypothetical protein